MTIERFNKRAGSNVATSIDDASMQLVGDFVPDTVRLPPELGGHVARVLEARLAPCPRGEHLVRHLALDSDPRAGSQVHVAECAEHGGFLWYRVTP